MHKVFFDAVKKYKIHIAAALVFIIALVLVLSSTNKDPFEYARFGQSHAEVVSKLGKPDWQDETWKGYTEEYHDIKLLGKKGTFSVDFLDENDEVFRAEFKFLADPDNLKSENIIKDYAVDIIEYYTKKYGEPVDDPVYRVNDDSWYLGDGSKLTLVYDYDSDYMVELTLWEV